MAKTTTTKPAARTRADIAQLQRQAAREVPGSTAQIAASGLDLAKNAHRNVGQKS